MKKIFAAALAVCTLLTTTACDMIIKNNDDEQYNYPVTVGNAVFEQAPQKTAVAGANLADIILACGYEGKLAMISDDCTQNELQILPSLGNIDDPDFNAMKSNGVDLLLTDTNPSEEIRGKLERADIKLMVIKPAVNDEQLEKIYTNIASLLGGNYTGRMKAMSTIDSIQQSLDQIKNSITDTEVLETACYIYDVQDDQCKVSNGRDYTAELFEYAHVINIAQDDDDGLIGNDTLLRSNPKSIFCDEGVYEKLAANNDLRSLSALASGRIYVLPSRYLTLQGNTRVITVDYIAAKTHDLYASTTNWPADFEAKKVEYVPPFTPQEGIFYTIGEDYTPIKDIEERLIGLGYLTGEADTVYTSDTAYAVSYFQSRNNISPTGIADYDTLSVLLSDKALAATSGNEGDAVAVEY